MEFDLYSCGDPDAVAGERRGCGFVARVLTGVNIHTRECPLCGARGWRLLGVERVGLGVVMPGVQRP